MKEVKKGKASTDADAQKDTGAEEEKSAACDCKEEAKTEPTIEDRLKKAEQDAQDAQDRLLRASAEFDNYKKRSEREVAEFRKFANETLIKALLPIMDNLERAIESAANDTENDSILTGVKLTLKEIYKVLEQFKLKSLEAEGKPFDPNFHQAVLQEETDQHPANTVIKVMQKGYILHDRLIRPAMVVVAKTPANPNPEKTPSEKDGGAENETKK